MRNRPAKKYEFPVFSMRNDLKYVNSIFSQKYDFPPSISIIYKNKTTAVIN